MLGGGRIRGTHVPAIHHGSGPEFVSWLSGMWGEASQERLGYTVNNAALAKTAINIAHVGGPCGFGKYFPVIMTNDF